MKRIYLLFAALLLITSCLAQDDIGKTFPKTIKFEQGVVVGDTGDFVQSIVFDNGKVEMNIDGVVYQLQPVTLSLSIDSAVVYDESPDTVYVFIDQAYLSDTSKVLWNITLEGGALSIDTLDFGDDYLRIATDTISLGEDPVLSYTKPGTGGIRDVHGNQMSNQTIGIINRTEGRQGTAVLIEDYRFEYDAMNEVTGYYGINSPGMVYTDEAAEGVYAGAFSSSNAYVTTLAKNYTSQASFTMGIISWGELNYNKVLWEMGGLKLRMNNIHRNLELWSFNASGDSAMASSDSLILLGTWQHVAITVDSAAGEAHFWIDAVDADIDTLFRNDFDMQDNMTIGADDDNTFRAYSFIDFMRNYTGHIVQDDVDELYNVIRTGKLDTITLAADTAYAGSVYPNQLIVDMNKDIYNSYFDTTAYEFFKDGAQAPIYSGEYSGDKIFFAIDSLDGGEVLRIRYDSSLTSHDLYDHQQIYADTFNLLARNDIISTSSCIAHYKVNDSPDDDLDDYDASPGNSASYSTTRKEGSHSLQSGDIFHYIQTPVLPADTIIAISLWFYNSTGDSDDQYGRFVATDVEGTTADRDGYGCYYDHVNGHGAIWLDDDDGNTQSIIATGGDPTTYAWIHGLYIIDMVDDSAHIYINGVLKASVATTVTVPLDEPIMIGTARANRHTGLVDDISFYGERLTDADALWLYQNPGERLSGGGGTCPCGGTWPDDCNSCDTIPNPEDFDILWTINYNNWGEQYTLPHRYTGSNPVFASEFSDGMITADWWGRVSGDGDLMYYYTLHPSSTYSYHKTYLDSIVEDPLTGSPCLKIFSRQGETHAANPDGYGGGENFEAYWDSEYEDKKEVYYSFNIMLKPGFDFSGDGKLAGVVSNNYGSAPVDFYEGFRASTLFTQGGIKNYLWFYAGDATREAWGDHYISNDKWYWGNDDRWGSILQPQGTDGNEGFDYSNGHWNFRTETYRWYNVTFRIVMNDDGYQNGIFEGYINGRMMMQLEGFEWRGEGWPLKGINGIKKEFFFGGTRPAQRDEWGLFDDEVVFEYEESYENDKVKMDYTANDPTVTLSLPYWPKTNEVYNIISIGNSIMGGTFPKDPPYADKVNELLYWNPKYNVTSIAHAGNLISNQLTYWNTELSPSQQTSADYVTMLIGINDVCNGKSLVDMKSDFNDLVSQISTDAPQAEIVVSTLTPAYDNTTCGISTAEYIVWQDFNAWLPTLEGVTVDKVYTTNTSDLNDGSDNLLYIYDIDIDENADGLHPNGAGHAVMYENLLDAIQSLQ